MSTSTTLPVAPIETLPYNASAVVSIVTWFLTVASILAITARISTKVALSRKPAPDDYLIFVALAFGIGQDIAVSLQSANGIGQHVDALSATEVDSYMKAAYAANILFIASLVLSKISVLLLIASITPVQLHVRLTHGCGILTVVWGMASIFVTAFACRLPQPWDFVNGQCINKNAFWQSFAAFNIVTEAVLVAIPIMVIAGLSTSLKRRLVIICCFGGRLFVIGAIVAQIYYQNKDTTADPTYTDWQGVLVGQIVQNLGIITSCIPYLKPLLESLESGMIRVDDLRRKGGSSYADNSTSSNSHQLGRGRLETKGSRKPSTLTGTGPVDLGPGRSRALVTGGKTGAVTGEWDRESQGSHSKMIRETRTWNVEAD